MSATPISTANAAVAHITGAIRNAAQAVGTSFNYLLATAKVESNLNPGAQASTSSAKGLFQFIEQTWLATMKEAGPRLGFGNYAAHIQRAPNGRMDVADPAMRAKILALRDDPKINAAMAGAFTNKNASTLQSQIGRKPTDGELYIAHFLGPSGAGKLIDAAATTNPPAAMLFPGAAAANRSVFYDKSGRARLASEVYANLNGRYETARAGTVALAEAAGEPPQEMLALRSSVSTQARAAVTTKVADTAGMAQAFADSQPPLRRLQDEPGPVFYALFHTGERQAPVSNRINQLWATPQAPSARVANMPTADQAPENSRPLDLFQDMTPSIRGLFTGRG